jgi:hypothetical protein
VSTPPAKSSDFSAGHDSYIRLDSSLKRHSANGTFRFNAHKTGKMGASCCIRSYTKKAEKCQEVFSGLFGLFRGAFTAKNAEPEESPVDAAGKQVLFFEPKNQSGRIGTTARVRGALIVIVNLCTAVIEDGPITNFMAPVTGYAIELRNKVLGWFCVWPGIASICKISSVSG